MPKNFGFSPNSIEKLFPAKSLKVEKGVCEFEPEKSLQFLLLSITSCVNWGELLILPVPWVYHLSTGTHLFLLM